MQTSLLSFTHLHAMRTSVRTRQCRHSEHADIGFAVIPFECDDITTCLDGFMNPPSLAQCVALGPTREESIQLDFSKKGKNKSGSDTVNVTIGSMAGPLVFHIDMADVFMWSRKARQFLNKCRDLMDSLSSGDTEHLAGSTRPAAVLDSLCAVYKDVAGINRCAEVMQDPRCRIDDSVPLHESLELALWYKMRNSVQTVFCSVRGCSGISCNAFSSKSNVILTICMFSKHRSLSDSAEVADARYSVRENGS